jgi:hypothetical protein
VPKLLTFEQAAEYLHDKFSARSIYRLVKRGKIAHVVISRKLFVTPEALDALVEDSTCRVPAPPPASISEKPAATTRQPGSSLTERKRLARAQAEMIANGRKLPYKSISPSTTGRQKAAIVPIKSSSPRH